MKLPKPKTYTTPIQSMKEDRYNLLKKNINKRKAVQLVENDLKNRLKNGPLQASVNFWKDKQYTTDFEVLHKPADVKKLKFDEEFMQDYDEETRLQDNDIISYLSIFYS